MEEAFDGREEDFIGEETDHDDDEHDADDLVHGVQFAAVMQKVAEAEAGQDGDVNLGGHEGAPGEGPALLHPANQKRKRSRQDDFGPLVQTGGAHRPGGPGEDGWDIAHAGIRGDDDRPDGPHDDDEQHGGFGLTEPKQGERDPADAGQSLKTESHDADGVFDELEGGSKQTERQSDQDADEIADHEPPNRDAGGLQQSSIARCTHKVFANALRRWEKDGRIDSRLYEEMPDQIGRAHV